MAYQKYNFKLSPEQYAEEKKKRIDNIVSMFRNTSTADLVTKIEHSYVTKNGTPSDSWSMMNRLIMQAHNTEDARTWKVWEQLGNKVRRGEKAFYIWKPISYMVKVFELRDKKHEGDPKFSKPKITYLKNKKDLKPNMEIIGMNFGLQAEFAVEQTENPDSIQYENVPKELPPLMDIAKRLGLKVSWSKYDNTENGHYNPAAKKIVLRVYDEGTFFHEIAHAIHHKIQGHIKGGQDIDQEVIAQVVSCIIGSLYGIDNTRYTKKYVLAYSNADGEQALKNISKNIDTISKILDFVFDCKNGAA